MQNNNPVRATYDYATGSGLDGFLSRSIDEVSWESTLESSFNSLSNLPIGLSPTTATPTNFDASPVSGSQGDSYNLGNIQMDGSSGGNITISG